ncbi:hypothetical protein B0H10DRAFT_1770268, partial [Mycena sp. CBHHK59/15]
EMLRLRRVVQQLQHRRKENSRFLHEMRRLVSPIRRIPPEILHMIFSHVVQLDKGDCSPSTAIATLWLAHVSSHWRTVIFGTSPLW